MIIKMLAWSAWVVTCILGIFLAAGLLGYSDGVKQDYSLVLYAIPLFLVCLILARALSRHAKASSGERTRRGQRDGP